MPIAEDTFKRIKAVQAAAPTVIETQLASIVEALSGYGRIEAAYVLLMLAFSAIRQHLSAEKARHDFKVWTHFAKLDKLTSASVPARPEIIALSDPKAINALRTSACGILLRHMLKCPITGYTRTQAAYALIVLAFGTLCRDEPHVRARRTFDILAPLAVEDAELAQAKPRSRTLQ
jgi:hypothetical protein